MEKKALIVVLGLTLILLTVFLNQNVTNSNQSLAIDGTTMGTSYHIKLVTPTKWKTSKKELENLIKLRLDDIDNKMSTYKGASDVAKFNQNSGKSWVPISAETMFVVDNAQKISDFTNGSFDITIGKLVNLWGFGPTINISAIPDAKTITELLNQSGYKKLLLRTNPPALHKNSEMLYIDLSAIAKGYAVDAVAQLLQENSITDFLVEIGGEIVTHGNKGENKPWVIGIEAPETQQRTVRKRLHLPNAAMATSGDYRNYFEENGVRYSHTIDPKTGYPIKHKLASITVISKSCMRADALATAIMVMGPEKGLAFAEANNLAVFMLVKYNNDFIEKQSSTFKTYLAKQTE